MQEIRVSGVSTALYNPFSASAEELMAAVLDEAGLLGPETSINGRPASDFFGEYCRKRGIYREVTRLGSLLVRHGILKEEDLHRALEFQRARAGSKLGDILVELGICSMTEIESHLDAQVVIREGLKDLEECRRRIDSIKVRLRRYF